MLFNRIRNWAVAACSFILASCGNKTQQQGQAGSPGGGGPIAVSVVTVQPGTATYYEEYPATVTALNQVDLRPQVNGYITGIFFKDGDRVRKGQRLYSIDQQQYQAQYQQSIANLQVQEANLARAEKDAQRYHQLDSADAVAKQQVDYADATLEATRRQVEAARANIRAVQTSVRYTSIIAPFDGTIGISEVKMGSPVTAGQTVLNTVSSDNPIAVDFTVDQRYIYRFAQMQNRQPAGDSTFTIAFGRDVYPYPGRITVVDRAVDPQTGTIRVRLAFPNAGSVLRPGMSGVIHVLNKEAEALVIPQKALTEQLGENFVYVVTGDKVSQRKVKTGQSLGRNILITDGLKSGEQIVTQGVQNLREGAAVKAVADTSAGK